MPNRPPRRSRAGPAAAVVGPVTPQTTRVTKAVDREHLPRSRRGRPPAAVVGGALDADVPAPAPPAPAVEPPVIVYASPDGPCPSPADAAAAGGPPGGPSAGRAALAALLDPLPLAAFWEGVFERRALVVHRGGTPDAAACVRGLFGVADVRALLRRGALRYGTGVDVVRFDGAVRHTLNSNDDAGGSCPSGDAGAGGGGGRRPKTGKRRRADAVASFADTADTVDVADATVVERRLQAGCSVRILHPQRWAPRLAGVLAALEGLTGSVVGANAYLTPPGAQGFAPHWDDIDAFVLQVCGTKRWRLYGPRSADEVLPRHSSADLDPRALGPLLGDVLLEPGDVLYMPRGTVHQADAPPAGTTPHSDTPSLHLTVSICQRATWADLLAAALPAALEAAAAADPGLRASVAPGTLLASAGVVHEDAAVRAARAPAGGGGGSAPAAVYASRAQQRAELEATLRKAAAAVMAQLSVDDVADAVGLRFMMDRMPPGGAAGGVAGGAAGEAGGRVAGDAMAGGGTMIRAGSAKEAKKRSAAAANVSDGVPAFVVPAAEGTAARLVVEGDSAVVWHCMANAAASHAAGAGDDHGTCAGACAPARVELPLEAAPAAEALLGVHSASPGDAIDVAALVDEYGPGVLGVVRALLDAGVVVGPAAAGRKRPTRERQGR